MDDAGFLVARSCCVAGVGSFWLSPTAAVAGANDKHLLLLALHCWHLQVRQGGVDGPQELCCAGAAGGPVQRRRQGAGDAVEKRCKQNRLKAVRILRIVFAVAGGRSETFCYFLLQLLVMLQAKKQRLVRNGPPTIATFIIALLLLNSQRFNANQQHTTKFHTSALRDVRGAAPGPRFWDSWNGGGKL